MKHLEVFDDAVPSMKTMKSYEIDWAAKDKSQDAGLNGHILVVNLEWQAMPSVV